MVGEVGGEVGGVVGGIQNRSRHTYRASDRAAGCEMTKDELINVLPGGKHHEVATAWAAGKGELQFDASYSEWETLGLVASFDRILDYRIKPQVVRYRVALMQTDNGCAYCHMTLSEEFTEAHSDFVRWATDWIEVTV